MPFDKNYSHQNNDVRYPRILTDEIDYNPLKPDEEFDFQEYSKAIVNIIKGSEPKFSIGIYGEWGSGKTTLMRLVENQLRPKIFTWENIPSVDRENQNLRNYLRDNFMLNGIEQLGISKSNDKKTIYLTNGKESSRVSIDLNRGQTKAGLRINDETVYEFLVQREKEGLSVRENDILTVWFNAWRYQSEDDFALIPLMKTIAYAMGEHPLYKDIKPVILRGLAIIGKDLLRYQASRFMTEKGIQEFEDNITRRIQNSVEFDKELIYFDGMKKIEDEMLTILLPR